MAESNDDPGARSFLVFIIIAFIAVTALSYVIFPKHTDQGTSTPATSAPAAPPAAK